MQSAANAPSTGPGAIAHEAVELGVVGERLADRQTSVPWTWRVAWSCAGS